MMTRKMRLNRGFTLIELMLAVSIIGILAAIAIPQFSTYTRKAEASEAGQIARPVLVAVAEFYDRWGRLPESNAAAGLPAAQAFRGRSVASIEISNGVVAVRFDADSKAAPQGGYRCYVPMIQLANPASALVWVLNSSLPPEGFGAAVELDSTLATAQSYNTMSSCKTK